GSLQVDLELAALGVALGGFDLFERDGFGDVQRLVAGEFFGGELHQPRVSVRDLRNTFRHPAGITGLTGFERTQIRQTIWVCLASSLRFSDVCAHFAGIVGEEAGGGQVRPSKLYALGETESE